MSMVRFTSLTLGDSVTRIDDWIDTEAQVGTAILLIERMEVKVKDSKAAVRLNF